MVASATPERALPERPVAGRYVLQEFRGDGAFSEVYAAWDVVLQRHVAVKLVHAASGKRPLISGERFLEEARVAARISHRNVVAVHDIGEHDGVPFLVMELLVGSLKRELEEHRVPPARACKLLADVADGLSAVHRGGIVHRDIKPANVLIGWDGSALLGDFGIARVLDDTDPNTLWQAGTPPYLAPERFAGLPSTPACDVWALGVVLYEALAGSRPFRDPAAVIAATYRPLREAAPGLPDSLGRLVAVCLNTDPDMRPPAEAVARALRNHAQLPELQHTLLPPERVTEKQEGPVVVPQRATPEPEPVPDPIPERFPDGETEVRPLPPSDPALEAPTLDRVPLQPEAVPEPLPEPLPEPEPAPADTVRVPPPRPAPAVVGGLSIEIDPVWYADQDVDDPCPEPGDPVVVLLDPAGVLVGRPSASLGVRPSLDLSSDVGVSRRHCRFTAEQTPEGLRWFVEDLGSSNGTFVSDPPSVPGGEPGPPQQLEPGELRRIRVGSRVHVGAWTRLTVVPPPLAREP